MLKIKLSFSVVMILIILGLFWTDTVNGYNGSQNMTENEVLELVKNNDEIISWLENHSIENEYIWGWGGFWTVKLNTYNQTNYYYLEIIVNDITQEVISINYYFDEYRTWELEQLILEDAETFLNESGYLTLFSELSDYYKYFSDFGRIEFQGWSENSYTGARLSYTHLLNGTMNFQLISIWSDSSFGEISVNFTTALIIAENTSIFKSFEENYGNYQYKISITQSLYFDSPYLQNSPGYVIFIQKSMWGEDFRLEFVDGEFIEVNNYDNDYRRSQIWIYNYHEVRAWVNASDGTIIDISKNYLDAGLYTNLANLAIQDPELSELVNDMRKFYGNFYHNYKDIFTLEINSEFSITSIEITINATSGEIVNQFINLPIPPTRTESEIVGIAFQDKEIQLLLDNLIEFDYWIYYNFEGTWYLEFYDKIMTEGWGYIEIDDVSGDIIYSSSWHTEPPNLIKSEVAKIALDVDLSQFNQDHPNARISMFFDWDRNWQIFIYDPVYVESYIKITVDDYDQQITNVEDNSISISSSNTEDDIRSYLQTLDEYKEFENLVGDKYVYIYFRNIWIIYLENIDSDKVLTQTEIFIGDTSLTANGGELQEYWANYNYKRIWPGELSDMFEYDWGFERLGKMPYTPLNEVIEDYIPNTPDATSTSLNEKPTDSLDLPGFGLGLSISILFITTIFVRKSKRIKS